MINADAHGGVVLAADIEEGHEAVLKLLEFLGILLVRIFYLLEDTGRVDIVAGIDADLLSVQGGHVSDVGVEVNVGNERSLITVGTESGVDVLEVLCLATSLRGETNQLASSFDDALSLSHTCLRIVGIGGGHRLYAYGRIATNLNAAHLDGRRLTTAIIKEINHNDEIKK